LKNQVTRARNIMQIEAEKTYYDQNTGEGLRDIYQNIIKDALNTSSLS
jgi:hypothetical protein